MIPALNNTDLFYHKTFFETSAEFEEIIQQKEFLKIAISISLKQWQSVPAFMEHHFTELMELLKN